MPLEGAHIMRKSLGRMLLNEVGSNEYEIDGSDGGGGWEVYTKGTHVRILRPSP